MLLCLGDLIIGWLLLRQAAVAIDALAGEPTDADRAFYQGKIAAATFFARQRFPLVSAERVVLENTDNSIMDLDESSF